MIFIIELHLTAVELWVKLLSLHGNVETKKVGVDSKSLPRFEGSLHFFNPCNSF